MCTCAGAGFVPGDEARARPQPLSWFTPVSPHSYIWHHLDIGYVQGMCDLLAPLLVILDDGECIAFTPWTARPLSEAADSRSPSAMFGLGHQISFVSLPSPSKGCFSSLQLLWVPRTLQGWCEWPSGRDSQEGSCGQLLRLGFPALDI